jgi:hypothetical protein
MADEIDQDQDVTQDLQDLHKEYETIVASLTACIKGLKTLRKTATATTAATTATDVRVRKGGVSKSLNRVLDKAEVDAIAAGTSYGSAVLEALEGATLE